MASDQFSLLKTDYYALHSLTATEKHYTFLVNNEIWLGRLRLDTVNLITVRSNLLKKWDAKFIQHPTEIESEIWMIFPNFTQGYTIDTSRSVLKSKKGQGDYWVAFFDEIAPQNEVCESELWIYGMGDLPSGYDPRDLLETYVMLWLLGVGDQTYNSTYVDLNKKQLHIMDYSTNRLKESQDAYFYFPKHPANKCKWFQHMGKYYQDVAGRLGNISELSPEYENKVVRAQDLLRKYYADWQSQFGLGPSISPGGLFPTAVPATAILGDIGVPRGSGKISTLPLSAIPLPITGASSTPIMVSSSKLPPPIIGSPPVGSSPSSISVTMPSIGKMSSRLGVATTYSGYSFNDMKSYLQKYIQAGMLDKARQVGVELYRIKELSDSSAKGNFTSFINILKIIAAEDIGVSYMGLSIGTIDFLNRNPDPSFEYIDGIISDFAEIPKTHLSEELWKTYTNAKCIAYAKIKNLPIDSDYTPEDINFINGNMNANFFKPADPLDLKQLALVFYKRLADKDYNAVTWWNFFIQASGKYPKGITARNTYYDGSRWKRIGGTDPTTILWDILGTLYGDDGTGPINVLRWAFFNNVKKADSRFYSLLAIIVVINQLPYKPEKMVPGEDSAKLLRGEYQLIMNEPFIVNRGGRNAPLAPVKLHPVNEEYTIPLYTDIASHC